MNGRSEGPPQAGGLPHTQTDEKVGTVTIRIATEADLSEIGALQAASTEAAHWLPADHLIYECRVAVIDGRIAGFLTTRQTAPGEREILNLAVDPDRRRRGIARRLLQEELGRGTWFLEVRESNIAAIQLYTS